MFEFYVRGVNLFKTSKWYALTQQQRSKDKDHTDLINHMGNGESLSMDDIKKDKSIDQNELDDEEWAFAPIIVSTNHERLDIFEIQAKRYAKQHKTHVIRWQLDITE